MRSQSTAGGAGCQAAGASTVHEEAAAATVRALAAPVVAAVLSWAAPGLATPTFVNGIAIPATTADLPGDPVPLNNCVSFLSDLY